MKIRRLTGAEIAIWRKVAHTVVARPGSILPEASEPMPVPEPAAAPRPLVQRPAASRETERRYAVDSYTPPVPTPKPKPSGLERRYRRKVADGRIAVEAVLDLHGMTQAQAHVALHRFVSGAQRDGARLVMVVTGKGLRQRRQRPDAAEPGVLRRAVPFWLRDGALRAVVIGFEEAALGHGGAGALYVRLRRPEP